MSESMGESVRPRQCGQCTACCQCLAISELNKPTFSKCPHQCDRGCAVYTQRPGSCRSFRCLWLMGFLQEEHRPDRLGVIFVTTEHPELGKVPMLIELRIGAIAQPHVQAAIRRMRKDTAVVVMTAHGRQVLCRLRPPRRKAQLAEMAAQMRPAQTVESAR